ncbi:MAG TPA: hypothetical protein VFY23_12190 [Candidatus Limnocylindrales bacterium]|nr:hypothetical protein [Candidatus Limnocylindrales bacterium]
MRPRERILSRLALGDDVGSLPARDTQDLAIDAVDPRHVALIRLGALLAMDASTTSLQRVVQDAQGAGVSPDEIVRCLVSLVPTIGLGQTCSIVPRLALALGFDIDASLEVLRPGV